MYLGTSPPQPTHWATLECGENIKSWQETLLSGSTLPSLNGTIGTGDDDIHHLHCNDFDTTLVHYIYAFLEWSKSIGQDCYHIIKMIWTFVRDRIPDVRYNQSERRGAYIWQKLWEFTILWWNWNDHLWQVKIFREERPCEEDPDGNYDFMVCVKNSQAEWHLI